MGFFCVWYITVGSALCLLASVHKWKMPYAILAVLILWPGWLAVAFYKAYTGAK